MTAISIHLKPQQRTATTHRSEQPREPREKRPRIKLTEAEIKERQKKHNTAKAIRRAEANGRVYAPRVFAAFKSDAEREAHKAALQKAASLRARIKLAAKAGRVLVQKPPHVELTPEQIEAKRIEKCKRQAERKGRVYKPRVARTPEERKAARNAKSKAERAKSAVSKAAARKSEQQKEKYNAASRAKRKAAREAAVAAAAPAAPPPPPAIRYLKGKEVQKRKRKAVVVIGQVAA